MHKFEYIKCALRIYKIVIYILSCKWCNNEKVNCRQRANSCAQNYLSYISSQVVGHLQYHSWTRSSTIPQLPASFSPKSIQSTDLSDPLNCGQFSALFHRCKKY